MEVEEFIDRELARSARLARGAPEPSTSAAPSPRPLEIRKRGAITLPQLLDALARARWTKSEAARAFQMSRPTFNKLIAENHPAVQQVLEISYDDIMRQYADCGADVQVLSKKLGIPADVLPSRLRRSGD